MRPESPPPLVRSATPSRRAAVEAVPVHLVLGDPRHGVARYAAELAEAVGADVVRDPVAVGAGDGPVHLHLTERLIDVETVERLARRVPLSVTLHDVPQPTDGPVFHQRAAVYARVARAVRGWVTSSEHERTLMARWCGPSLPGAVVPLPVLGGSWATGPGPVAGPPVLGIFGFVYPGKGHRELVRAASALRREGIEAEVLVVGGPADRHATELEEVRRMAQARGVPLRVTGHLPDAAVPAALRSVAVPVVGHRNVSASGSLNSWLAAGRRPLVRDGSYAREMATLRPGTTTLFRDESLVDRVADALAHPPGTWLADDVDLRPRLDDTARAYRSWWRTLS